MSEASPKVTYDKYDESTNAVENPITSEEQIIQENEQDHSDKILEDDSKIEPINKDDIDSSAEEKMDNGIQGSKEIEEYDEGLANEDEDEDADSDFGSFDDASFTEFEEPEEINSPSSSKKAEIGYAPFSEEVFANSAQFEKNLHEVLDQIFPNINNKQADDDVGKLSLTDRSSEIFEELSKIPHLQPPNWTKLNVRHNLLIKLGVPINLDELKKENISQSKLSRRRSVNEEDIKWDGFEIPKFEDLSISSDKKTVLLDKTTEILSSIERDNLNNSSRKFLESSNSTIRQEKLQQYKENYAQLIELSSVWNKQLDDQKKNSEIYESVVQNLIGYSQKLKREEILADLKKIKLKSKSRKKSFWK